MDLELKDKSVLITGGSMGIGRACAEVMAAEGCKLHLAARGEKGLAAAKEAIEAAHGQPVEIHPYDLSESDQARALAETCADIDILVNNAGAIPRGDLWQIDEKRWRKAWDLKVFGYINLCRAVYPKMKAHGGGVIVNVIGAGGQRPHIGYIAGGPANASLMAFTMALGASSLADGIRVVAVNPGLIKTRRLESLMRSRAEERFQDPSRWQELLPVSHPPGEPEDIAHAVAFLASKRAGHISATVLTVDGGATSA